MKSLLCFYSGYFWNKKEYKKINRRTVFADCERSPFSNAYCKMINPHMNTGHVMCVARMYG